MHLIGQHSIQAPNNLFDAHAKAFSKFKQQMKWFFKTSSLLATKCVLPDVTLFQNNVTFHLSHFKNLENMDRPFRKRGKGSRATHCVKTSAFGEQLLP